MKTQFISTLEEARVSPRATLFIKEVATLMGLDQRTAKRACDMGEIPSVRVGKRTLIPRERFLDFVSGREEDVQTVE